MVTVKKASANAMAVKKAPAAKKPAAAKSASGKAPAKAKAPAGKAARPAAKKTQAVKAAAKKPVAKRTAVSEIEGASISTEALKIGLLLSAIDGHCDQDELAKFRKTAKACGDYSNAKIEQMVAQMQNRIASLENMSKAGSGEDEILDAFMKEARKIGIKADSRAFVLWMSIAMVDGDFSGIERKAICALKDAAAKDSDLFGTLFGHSRRADISDIFLKRCEMILSGIYKATLDGDKALAKNRMDSLKALVEIAEA